MAQEVKKVALVGGGSGGHIVPLISLYRFCQDDESLRFLYVGEKNSLEERLASEGGIPFFSIVSEKLRRYFAWQTFIAPFKILYGIFQSLWILHAQKIDVVFSKGSHVSIPVAIAAKILRIPFYIHDSDSVPGLANRIAARFASRIFLGFSHAQKFFPRGKTEVVGQILNPELFSHRPRDEKDARTHLLVIGGSQGSRVLSEFVLEHIEELGDFRISIILGTKNELLSKAFEGFSHVQTYAFVSPGELAAIYASTDIALTRSSATIMAELAAFGIPMIMVPLPHTGGNHQYYNALEYQDVNHVLLGEAELNTLGMSKLLNWKGYKKTSRPPSHGAALHTIKKFLVSRG